jgi:hypothetical protein
MQTSRGETDNGYNGAYADEWEYADLPEDATPTSMGIVSSKFFIGRSF